MTDNKTMADALLSAAEVARALNLGRENCVSVSVDAFAHIRVHLEPHVMPGLAMLTGRTPEQSDGHITLYHNGVRYCAVEDSGVPVAVPEEEV